MRSADDPSQLRRVREGDGNSVRDARDGHTRKTVARPSEQPANRTSLSNHYYYLCRRRRRRRGNRAETSRPNAKSGRCRARGHRRRYYYYRLPDVLTRGARLGVCGPDPSKRLIVCQCTPSVSSPVFMAISPDSRLQKMLAFLP